MEPYYAAAEQIVGVAGEAGANPFASWRADPYPMPPGPDMFCAVLTSEAATRLGYHPYRAPTGVNSVEYDGRPACNNCGFCGVLRLPDRRQGRPGRAAAPRAAHRAVRDPARGLRHRRAARRHRATRARGVRYLDHDLVEHEVSADHVVLAARRVRDAAAAAAHRARQPRRRRPLPHVPLPDVRARHLPVPAARPPRPGGDAPAWTTRSSPTRDAQAAARAADLPFLRGGIVEHGGAGASDHGGDLLPPRAGAHARRCSTRRCATAWPCSRCRARTCPQATNRIDLDPRVQRRVRHRPPGGSRTSRTATRSRAPSTGRRGSRR